MLKSALVLGTLLVGVDIREGAAQTVPAALPSLIQSDRVELTVAGATTLRVPVRIGRSEFLRLDVHADGADLRVGVLAASGQLIAESGRLRETAAESVMIVDAVPGRAIIQMRAAPTRSEPGRVEIVVAERRPVEPHDVDRTAAQRAYGSGWTLLEAASASVLGARRRFLAAQKVWAELGEMHMEAQAWSALGETYDRTGAHTDGLAAAERRRSLAITTGDVAGELWAATDAAWQQLQSGDEKSRDSLMETLARWQAIGNRRGESAARVLLGAFYTSAGDKEQAGTHLTQALELLESEGDVRWRVIALQQLGNYHNTFGERQRAVEDFSQAVKLLDLVRDRRTEATLRHDFGTLYNMLGEYELARGEEARSLTLARQAGDVELEAHVLMNIGVNYADLNEPVRAVRYLTRARSALQGLGDRRSEAIVLNNLASIQRDLGQSAESLATVEAAHRAFVDLGMVRGEMISLTSMGFMSCRFARYDEGHARLEDAIRLAREATDRAQEALALSFSAGCDADAGNLSDARVKIDDAHALVEQLRLEILRDDLRSSFFSTARPILERKVDILMRLAAREPEGRWKAEAFEVSEAARARSLLELVPVLKSSEDARVPKTLAAARDALVAKLRNASDDSAGAGDLLAEYYQLRSRMRAENPRYAELTDPQTLSLEEAQALLAPGTVVLEYLLGRDRGDLWAITRDQAVHATLPGRQEIERLGRRMVQSVRRRETTTDPADLAAADQRYWRDARALSRILLTPVGSMLKAQKVYVVPDGVLHLVPFAALPTPNGPAAGRPVPLIVSTEVSSIPSLSVLAFAGAAAQKAPGTAPRIAVIADPVYEANDPRLSRPGSARTASPGQDQLPVLRRLAGSSEEADAIARAAGGRNAVTRFDGFEASRSALAGSSLQPFRVVHFATHGLLDSRRPERSGLVFSLFDRQGQPADGYLRLLDVYDMSLSTDLVVMSACETALGREMEGEGVIGLTRGFLLAGAANVVSSQWKIPDTGATPQLMAWFYSALLEQNMSPAAALRYAQTRMWNSREWSAPYYWASFTLYGG